MQLSRTHVIPQMALAVLLKPELSGICVIVLSCSMCQPCSIRMEAKSVQNLVVSKARLYLQNKNNPENHEGVARRFVMFGGGISSEQLSWLRQQLHDAKEAEQRVLLFSHLPLHPDTCVGTCLLWNYEEVLHAIWQAGNVVATIAGHAHNVSATTAWCCKYCTVTVRSGLLKHLVRCKAGSMQRPVILCCFPASYHPPSVVAECWCIEVPKYMGLCARRTVISE